VKGVNSMKRLVSLFIAVAMLCSLMPTMAVAETTVPEIFSDDSLVLWVKGSKGLEEINGQTVWRDYSGKNNHMVPMFGTPTYKESAINGKGAMVMEQGVGGALGVEFAEPYIGSSTFFIVAKVNKDDDSNWRGIFSTNSPNTSKVQHTFEGYILNNNIEGSSYNENSDGGKDTLWRTAPNEYPWGEYKTLVFRAIEQKVENVWTATTVDTYLGNSRVAHWDSRGDVNNRFNKYNGFILGNRDKIEPWATPSMEVAEALVFHKALTDEELVTVNKYLNTKYYGSGEDPFEEEVAEPEPEPEEPNRTIFNDMDIVLWVKGNSNLEMIDGELKWRDYSGNGNHMKPMYAIPTYEKNAINGKSALRIHKGVGDSLGVKFAEPFTGSGTFFIVANIHQPAGNDTYDAVFSTNSPDMPKRQHTFEGYALGGIIQGASFRADGGDDGKEALWRKRNAEDTAFIYPWDTFQILSFRGTEITDNGAWAGTTIETFLDTNRIAIWQGSPTGRARDGYRFNQYNGFTIGNRWSMDSNGSSNLDVAEIMVFRKALTDEEMEIVNRYLHEKYFGNGSDPFDNTSDPGTEIKEIPDGGRLALWVDGASADILSKKWNDKSPKKNHLVFYGTPSIKTNAINGKPAVILDGNKTYATCSLLQNYVGSTEIFMVLNIKPESSEDNVSHAYKGLFSTSPFINGNDQANRNNGIFVQFTGEPIGSRKELRLRSNNAFQTIVWWSDHPQLSGQFNKLQLQIQDNSGSGTPSKINFDISGMLGLIVNNADWSKNQGESLNTHSGYTIGAAWDEGAAINAEIAEVIIYQGELTEAERAQVNEYLNNKYYTLKTGDVVKTFLNAAGEVVDSAVAGGKIKLNGNIVTDSPTKETLKDGQLIAAIYDKDGALTSVDVVNVQSSGIKKGKGYAGTNEVETVLRERCTFETDYMNLPDDLSNTSIKLFLWDSLDGLVPFGQYTGVPLN